MGIFPHKASGTWARAAKYLVDIALWTLVVPVAFFLRRAFHYEGILPYIAFGLSIKFMLLYLSRIERRSWSRSSLQDLLALATVIGTGTGILFVLGLVLYTYSGFPRTVPLISGALAIVVLGGVRVSARMWSEERVRKTNGVTKRVLLVGAGEAGGRMVREMRRHSSTGLMPAGYLDDDPAKQGTRVAGVKVYGSIEALGRVTRALQVDEVLIAMPSATGPQTRRVVDVARAAHVPCRILPSLSQVLLGEARITAIREVDVGDLLRRDPVRLDELGVEAYICDSVVLVTGAGGSIGSEIVRQLARFGPERVVLLGRGENPLHELECELRQIHPELSYATVVGSVCDGRKMAEVFSVHHPDIVFHAAAHKHVPMMQYNPDEAILNNVGGTRTVGEAALHAGVGRFVNVSTDKAVNPISMMGCTKYLAEKLVRALSEAAAKDQTFVSVRFGNVLGSRGSVVPMFQEQIRRGGPITITDPEATRYFMTIAESAQLVLQAGAMGENGCVYVLDMGEPVRIADLARDLVRLTRSGDETIEFVFTAMRPGEKLHEELFAVGEEATPTAHEKILVARQQVPVTAELETGMDALLRVAEERDWAGIDREMAALVSGYGSLTDFVAVP